MSEPTRSIPELRVLSPESPAADVEATARAEAAEAEWLRELPALRTRAGEPEGRHFLVVHAHFYQPPRENPFTGRVPLEPGAAPYHDFNEKITAECYAPNAARGNFGLISFDLGPTLAEWLERYAPSTYRTIIAAERGNGLAQGFHHTILPLASRRDKVTQVRWAIADFRHRFGRAPEGFWLPETAADLETLEVLAEEGIRFTVLAPWQADTDHLDVSRPYRVPLPGGRSIAVFFFDAGLSAGVSFDPHVTENADHFAAAQLGPRRNGHLKRDRIVLVATDGELYGHHRPFRDRFLHYLLTVAAPAAGFEVTHLADYLRRFPPTDEVALRGPGSWSCAHGVARWSTGCDCTEGDRSWKPRLRGALDRLAARLEALSLEGTRGLVADFWAARDDFVRVRLGIAEPAELVREHAVRTLTAEEEQRVLQLLQAQWFGQRMYASCAWFWDDLDRVEPKYALASAAYAVRLARAATGDRLEADFLVDLSRVRSGRTGRTAAQIYSEVVGTQD